MTIRTEILKYARDNDIPDWMMCNHMCLTMEEYRKFQRGELELSLFYITIFVLSTGFVPRADK